MESHRELKVLQQHIPLLLNRWWGGCLASEHLSCLLKDPRIADAPTRHGNGVYTRGLEHQKDVIDAPDVAAAKDQVIWTPIHEITKRLPSGGAEVFLCHGAAVHRDPRVPHLIRGIKDRLEVFLHLLGVIK